jgi:hypothetical protein
VLSCFQEPKSAALFSWVWLVAGVNSLQPCVVTWPSSSGTSPTLSSTLALETVVARSVGYEPRSTFVAAA